MDARVGVELGVEGAGQLVGVAHGGHGAVGQGGEGARVAVDLRDARGADERHGERLACGGAGLVEQRALGVEAAELTSVGVAQDADGQRAEVDRGVGLQALGQ